jgi:hypothetical protein
LNAIELGTPGPAEAADGICALILRSKSIGFRDLDLDDCPENYAGAQILGNAVGRSKELAFRYLSRSVA